MPLLYCHTREALEKATSEFVHTASEWGLTVNVQKTKALIMGRHLAPTDIMPVQIGCDKIEVVQDFTYLGSNITVDGEVHKEVKVRIAKASRAFGCLQRSIFQNHRLSIETKRNVYKATVISALLYGAETWTTKVRSLKCLSGFHNRCVRTIMGVSKYQQWMERISSRLLAAAVGIEETMADILMKHCLRWLGHLARMESHRLPKQLLFGELQKKRPSHGTKRRWRDVAAADVRAVAGDDDDGTTQDRKVWRAICRHGLAALEDRHRHGMCAANIPTCTSSGAINYPCPCGRSFRRLGDRTRHSRFCSSADAGET